MAIIKVGIATERYVSLRNARPWVMHGFKNTRGRGSSFTTLEDAMEIQQTDGVLNMMPDKEATQSTPVQCPGSFSGTKEQSNTSIEVTDITPADRDSSLSTQEMETVGESRKDATPPGNTLSDFSTEQVESGKQKDTQTDEVQKSLETKNEEPQKKPEQHSSYVTRTSSGSLHVKSLAESKKPDIAPALSTYDRIRILIAPWRKPEGYVNKPVFKMMVESLMLYIISNPGCHFQSICAKYNPFLQPFHILILLETLEDIGCVRKIIVKKRPKSSLFSKPVVPVIVEEENGGDQAFYESTVECIIRLGQFMAEVMAPGSTLTK